MTPPPSTINPATKAHYLECIRRHKAGEITNPVNGLTNTWIRDLVKFCPDCYCPTDDTMHQFCVNHTPSSKLVDIRFFGAHNL